MKNKFLIGGDSLHRLVRPLGNLVAHGETNRSEE
jgi:hypothetical protein